VWIVHLSLRVFEIYICGEHAHHSSGFVLLLRDMMEPEPGNRAQNQKKIKSDFLIFIEGLMPKNIIGTKRKSIKPSISLKMKIK